MGEAVPPVVIVGAGASGALLAMRLSERDVDCVLVERGDRFGTGLAYGTTRPEHRLNVRSGRMSGRPDRPGDFTDWLAANGRDADPEGFAARADYGLYLEDGLKAALASGRVRLERGEAVRVTIEGVDLSDGHALTARAVVLATGNAAPDGCPGEGLTGVVCDPWESGALDRIATDARVVLLGTGLTAVDVILALDAAGWRGEATLLSRRGLLPRPHDEVQPKVSACEAPDGPLSRRTRTLRRALATRPWGEVMDALRPTNAATWSGLDAAERARFLRHLRPWWDVHRHRLAPEPARRIGALAAAGRLDLVAGRLLSVEAGNAGLDVTWRPRGEMAPRRLTAEALIDCTGPALNPARSGDPLTRALIADGLARPDVLGIGLDSDGEGRVRDASGRPSERLLMLGPPERPALWETIAIPDIAARAVRLADRLAADGPSRRSRERSLLRMTGIADRQTSSG